MSARIQDKPIKTLFVGVCWQYLYENFHKFKEANKIKVALELCKKDLGADISQEASNDYKQLLEMLISKYELPRTTLKTVTPTDGTEVKEQEINEEAK